MQRHDRIRLQHMLDAANEALEFVRQASFGPGHGSQAGSIADQRARDYRRAAGKVSAEIRTQYGAIPWQDISGMRNRLIHVYFDIDLDLVWTTVIKDLPLLKTELEKIL